jgi:hypothetical protein
VQTKQTRHAKEHAQFQYIEYINDLHVKRLGKSNTVLAYSGDKVTYLSAKLLHEDQQTQHIVCQFNSTPGKFNSRLFLTINIPQSAKQVLLGSYSTNAKTPQAFG